MDELSLFGRDFLRIVQICQPTLDGNKVDSVEFINSRQLWRLLWEELATLDWTEENLILINFFKS